MFFLSSCFTLVKRCYRLLADPGTFSHQDHETWLLLKKKQADIERCISGEKYRQVFTNVSRGLMLFELSDEGIPGRIQDMNPGAEELTLRTLPGVLVSGDTILRHLPINESEQKRGISGGTSNNCSFESAIIRCSKPVHAQNRSIDDLINQLDRR